MAYRHVFEEGVEATVRQSNAPVGQFNSTSMETVTSTIRIDSSNHIIGIENMVNDGELQNPFNVECKLEEL